MLFNRRDVKKKKGFTLIEIIVTLVILGIVSASVIMVFDYTNRSFVSTSVRYDTQVEARRLMERLRNELGYANSVALHVAKPATLPDAASKKGYCFAASSSLLVNRLGNQQMEYYFNQITRPVNVSVTFTPKAPDNSSSGKVNVIQVTITSDVFTLTSDIFVQNLGTSNFTYFDASGVQTNDFTQGGYIEYTLPVA